MILPGQLMMPVVAGGPSLNLADAATFNGTTDYLIRNPDLIGNADGAVFTLSCWLYVDTWNGATFYSTTSDDTAGNFRFLFYQSGVDSIVLLARATSGTTIVLIAEITVPTTTGTWYHFLASINLANTVQRSIYLNDAAASVAWDTYSTSSAIDLATNYHNIGTQASGMSPKFDGRLCHFYMDRTYRNLSATSNRRLFNNGAGGPAAGQASLNPIIYLPLVSSNPWGENLGTGGDFTGAGGLA